MLSPAIERLLQDLRDEDSNRRDAATEALWQMWFTQKGTRGLQRLRQSQVLLEGGHLAAAEELLSRLIADLPDFAEAWNRRAVLYFVQERYEEAKTDCQRVVELIPYHFGALHGLGLCYAALEQYREAIQAFQQALEVQPYALANQRLILECTLRLEDDSNPAGPA
ncbi:MAG TPA: tetratricopeptide repeat protein [Leptolyngbyaceae cyanobacterium M65_K2018_010]|nr:tetratricopeptide repeat protein [Leptolyngbyaceae cyanobacterium M65_K2018_010]